MKAFRKLALVSAIATLPATGFAMQAMDDAALSGVTGQDGIAISLNLNAQLNVGIEDTTGFTGATDPGLLLLVGHSIAGDITLNIDSGSRTVGGNAEGVLRVGVDIQNLNISTGDIHVMPGTDGTDLAVGMTNLGTQVTASATSTPVLESMTIGIDSFNMDIELGAGATDFLNITAGNIGTLSISDFKLNDLGGGGAIGIEQISINGIDLTGTKGSLTANGLSLTLGASMNNIDIAMDRVSLNANEATPSYLGNVYISGLNLGSTVVSINGK